MFCPFCNRLNEDGATFCNSCGKALPQQSFLQPAIQSPQSSQQFVTQPKKQEGKSKSKSSSGAVRALVTVVAIIILVLIVFVIYYPNLLPWNW